MEASTNGKGGDWYDSELPMRTVMIRELQRFKRRLKARPVWVLLVAALLTAGLLKKISSKQAKYNARVTLRISEGTLNTERAAPLPNRALKDYIYSYVLTKSLILENVILNPDIVRLEPGFKDAYDKFGLDYAVEEVRDGLNVRPFRNYFLFGADYDATPRSLHLTIRYTHTDPELAYLMASILADLIIDNESARRLREARYKAADAARAMAAVEAAAAEKQKELNRLQLALIEAEITGDVGTAAAAKLASTQLSEEVRKQDQQLKALRARRDRVDNLLRLEERQMALFWEIAGEDRPRFIPPPGPIRLTAFGLVFFCILVPVCAIGFGAFDSRIHESDDVGRLGMPVVGHIPGFQGDHVGSLAYRGALAGRGILGRIGFIRNRRLRYNRVA